MSDESERTVRPAPQPSHEWAQAVRYFNETRAFGVREVCAVLGNPVGGVVGSARPDIETTYRNAAMI